MINISTGKCIHYSEISAGACASSSSAAVRSGNEFHIVQAVFLPCPTNPDMVLQPVGAWNIGRASGFSVLRLAAIRWAAKYQKFFRFQMLTSLLPGSVALTITANTTTFVSTLQTKI